MQKFKDLGPQSKNSTVNLIPNKYLQKIIERNYDGDTTKIFLDGEVIGTAAFQAQLIPDDNPVTIALETNEATEYLDEKLDDIRIYNIALNETEISELYHENEWPIITFIGNDNTTLLPNEYNVSQNYPNPFNPVTKISYALPSAATVDLKVYNVLGQLITTLVNEEKPAGFYEVDFNAADLPSGVYMYRIQAGDYVETKKMLLLK